MDASDATTCSRATAEHIGAVARAQLRAGQALVLLGRVEDARARLTTAQQLGAAYLGPDDETTLAAGAAMHALG